MSFSNLFYGFLVLSISLSLHGQEVLVDPTANLEIASKKMIKSLVEEDYATYIDMSYPAYVEVNGGKDVMIKQIKSTKDAIKAAGMVLLSADFESSEAIVEDSLTMQSIVTFNYIQDIANNKYQGQQYLLAISEDNGTTWTFVELETHDAESIIDFVPIYNKQLAFPEIRGATYIEDNK